MAGSQSSEYKNDLAAVLKAKRNFFIYVVGTGKWFSQQETVDAASYADFVFYNKYPELTPKVAPKMSKAITKGMRIK